MNEKSAISFAVAAGLLLLALIFGHMLQKQKDYDTGKVVMGLASVIDKEQVITRDDGAEIARDYFLVVSAATETKRLEVPKEMYEVTPVGSKVVVDTRIGGLSNTVVEETARPYKGAEGE